MKKNFIHIEGARQNNLKNISLSIPKNKLIVFTGVSGSGKSSLAFNTIYAEGQRRYVESLSSYARQFLGISNKPDVDKIENLSPAISIEQKVVSHNPRSTVGTVTEIYDYLRLLYARVGKPYCPLCNQRIESQTISYIINKVLEEKEDSKIIILSPIIINKKGTHQNILHSLKNQNFSTVIVNNEPFSLDNEIMLEKNKKHTIDCVIDRLILDKEDEDLRIRLRDGLEIASKHANGLIKIINETTKKTFTYSQNFVCKKCNFNIHELEPRLFSFNAPVGACEMCKGIGKKQEVDIDLLIPDRSLSIEEGGIVYYQNFLFSDNIEWQVFHALLEYYDIDVTLPIKGFSDYDLNIILQGSDEPIQYTIITKSHREWQRHEYIEGVAKMIQRRYFETKSESSRRNYRRFLSTKDCNICNGARLNSQSLAVKINGKNVAEICNFSIKKIALWINELKFDKVDTKISHHIINEIKARLEFLINVGLNYLTLSRSASTLSGGESQRIRLATQIGSKLTGILYVLDEPSIGLHQSDNERLIKTLKAMRDIGNTLIVVEHDEETIESADFVVDIGKDAGDNGGNIICLGPVKKILECKDSYTGLYLKGVERIEVPKKRRQINKRKTINVYGAASNNLQNIDVKFPIGLITAITGVSGSGKSTLINNVLYQGIRKHLMMTTTNVGKYHKISGIGDIEKIIHVTQDPIGRTPRSNPATYTKVFDHIRDLFANTLEAKARGYLKGRFSFNVPGGRCEKCQGDGTIKIEMHFLPDVYVQCDECNGKRYNDETLQIKYKHHSISDILNLTVEHALKFFQKTPKVNKILQTLDDVGLGYIKLGQSALEFSGGEAQRIKIASFLNKISNGKTLYLLDEPTTGLHIHDVKRLIDVLQRLVENGDTVILIEHNLEVIKTADFVIDLGPGGGEQGGQIVAVGTPERIAKTESSLTGQYLTKYFETHKK